jgi:hypothetical protein
MPIRIDPYRLIALRPAEKEYPVFAKPRRFPLVFKVCTLVLTLALAGCGGDGQDSGDGEGSAGDEAEVEKDVGSGPVSAQEFEECITRAGHLARSVPKQNEADSTEAIRGTGLPLEQVTVETADYAGTIFVAVMETEEDAERAEPAAQTYSDTAVRHGNVITYYYDADEEQLQPVVESCTP